MSCGAVEECCVCRLEKDHEGLHVCDCGGSWGYDEDGKFQIGRLPGAFGEMGPLSAMGALLGLFPDERP